MQKHAKEVNRHYGRGDLEAIILTALETAGKGLERLTLEDLAPVDHFHTTGKRATLGLMRLATLEAGMKVLDVGGGIGGAARLLAAEKGCQMTVLDLTEEYCRVGEMLTERTRLSDRVTFRHGSALNMPFPDACFDMVWSQHCSMNIADKARFYEETHRVLRPAGQLVFHEVMAGPVQPLHFPVPWAGNPAMSFLRPAEEIRILLAVAGFKEVGWIDTTATSITWFQQRNISLEREKPVLGVHLLLGPRAGDMFRNQVHNLQERRAIIVQAVFERI